MTYKPTAGDPLRELAAVRQNIVESREKLASLVLSARECGASWSDVGAALGVAKQVVHKKYAPLEYQPLSDQALDALLDAPQE